jgi:succinoglycan biosynthesis protein ExoA
MRGEPRVSICVVTGRRLRLLDECLASIEAQVDAPPHEVLVCSDGDREVADAVTGRLPDARVCLVDRALPGAARNLLVREARGDLLFFVDDDATLEPHALALLVELADAHPESAVFGGPNDTPPGSSRFEVVQGAALASFLGSGPVRRRYGAHPAGPADERFFILCNLAIRRDAMLPFASDLVCAEENAVLSAMSRDGVAMYYDPRLVAYHHRRPTLRGFARQMFKYGHGRGQLTRQVPATLRPAYLVPSVAIVYALLAPLLAVVLHPAALLPLALYAVGMAVSAAWIAWTLRRARDLPLAALLLVVLHAAYGAGVLRGLFRSTPSPPEPEVLAWAPARYEDAAPVRR